MNCYTRNSTINRLLEGGDDVLSYFYVCWQFHSFSEHQNLSVCYHKQECGEIGHLVKDVLQRVETVDGPHRLFVDDCFLFLVECGFAI